MTDPRRVADALSALADGTAPESVEHRTVVADAADAAADVRDAARFVAGGGRGRLRLAVSTAERAGDRDAAESGRRTLDALARFRAAAAGTAGADADLPPPAASRAGAGADDSPTDGADAPAATAATAGGPLPLRSRNDFTRRRSSGPRRK